MLIVSKALVHHTGTRAALVPQVLSARVVHWAQCYTMREAKARKEPEANVVSIVAIKWEERAYKGNSVT